MSTYGSHLFRRSGVLKRYLETLPVKVHATIGALLAEQEWTQGPLLKQLASQFVLQPLQPAELTKITIEHYQTSYINEFGDTVRGYFVQGHVPYTGSRLLWNVNPQQGFKLGLRGKVGPFAVNLCSFIRDTDIGPFGTRVDEELARLHEALPSCRSTLASYNSRIWQELDLQVRTY